MQARSWHANAAQHHLHPHYPRAPLQGEFSDFQESSAELEKELESELKQLQVGLAIGTQPRAQPRLLRTHPWRIVAKPLVPSMQAQYTALKKSNDAMLKYAANSLASGKRAARNGSAHAEKSRRRREEAQT